MISNWNHLILAMLAIFFSGCANPLATIQPEIDYFTKAYPQNFGNVKLESKNIHYAWSGDKDKQPLVFVHGSPGSWKGWAHFLLDKNLQRNFHLIAIDRFGYGESNPGKAERSLERQARAVLKVLSLNQSFKKALLVGHSFGGPVIAKAAILAPDKIGGLVFVASSVSPDLEETKWFQYPASWWPIKALIPHDLRVCNEEIFSLKSELLIMEKEWDKIKSKVAIIHGLDDRLVPPENADYILNRLNKDLIVMNRQISSQGHFIPWQQPYSILEAINSLGN